MPKREAPYRDFQGKPIFEGDRLIHPLGDVGTVVYEADREDQRSRWRVKYDDQPDVSLWLSNQIGDKGRAVVVPIGRVRKQPHADAIRANKAAQKKTRERDIEAHLVKSVKALGGEVRKVQWIGRRGAPDRLVMLPKVVYPKWSGSLKPGTVCWAETWSKPSKTIFVELKAPGEKPTTLQLREHERMRAMGQTVVVIDSIEGVDDLLA